MLNDLLNEIWRELEAGAKTKDHPFNTCALATLGKTQRVRQRTVNLRELTTRHTLLIYTDARSAKMEHLENNPRASVLFYNPAINLQVTISGKVKIHTDDELWQEHKMKIDGRSVNDYNTKSSPGKKIKNPMDVSRTTDINFALLELVPETIEYLKLRTEPNRLRALFEKDAEGWEKTFLIP